MDLATLLAEPPDLHRTYEGDPISLAAPTDVLRYIAARIGPSSRTLETGAGLSTLVFALAKCEHICVVLDDSLVDRIKSFAAAYEVDTDRLRFVIDRSDAALPALDPGDLDLILIDGAHAFPVPFIDWYYTAPHLQVGGILVIDDTQLWTGSVLKEFLTAEPGWRPAAEFDRSVAFEKTENTAHREWIDQPYVVSESQAISSRRIVAQLERAMKLARRGEYSHLAKSILSRALRVTRPQKLGPDDG